MNLKQFAINRKLTHNHKLLDYVVDDKPVPCDVLEDSLKEFIEPLHDKTSEMLLDDYQTMLKDTVPIIISKDGNGGHVISGDVPDAVLEAIQLVHKVSPEDAIEEMIKANMLEINNQKVTVTNVSLKEQVLAMTKAQMHNIPPVQDVVATAPMVATAPTMVVGAPAMVETTAPMVEVETTAPMTVEAQTTVGEIADTIQTITTVEDDGLPFETNETPITAQDEPDEMGVETQPDEDKINMSEAVKRIYDKLVRDIKLYNLDKSLNLDM